MNNNSSSNATRDDNAQATTAAQDNAPQWFRERSDAAKLHPERLFSAHLYTELTPEELRSKDTENWRLFAEAQERTERIKRGLPAEYADGDSRANRKAGPALIKDGILLLSDLDLQSFGEQRWRVKNVIPDVGIGVIYGDSGTFKSFVALDLQAAIATGVERWFGHRVTKAPCVYVPLEGRGGIPKRVEAWRFAMALNTMIPSAGNLGHCFNFDVTTGIRFVMDPINLRNASDRAKLIDALKAAELAGGLVCIDTLAQAGGGGVDENSSEGMGELIRIMQELQVALGGVVLAIHHTGKDTSRGMRGHSSLRGAVDFAIECSKPEGAGQYEAQIRLDKVKDEAAGTVIAFRMERVFLGEDEDGDPITSLVVEQPNPNMPTVVTTPSPADTAEQEAADDEQFVYEWTKREVDAEKYPSSNSLQGQLAEMKAERAMTQKRVRDAIHRLRAKSLLVDAPGKSPSGNKWLRYVDPPRILEKQG